MNNLLKLLIGVVILGGVGFLVFGLKKSPAPTTTSTNTGTPNPAPTPNPVPTPNPAPAPVSTSQVVAPLAQSASRVTKKPFGIYITPQNSPVQPERFSGYHTGVDFETFPNEQNIDVPFYAICAGKILVKRTATGYGGVFVQSCTINNQMVTVIYGHVSLKSIAKNVGDSLVQDEKIGYLGQPPTETDGERKHLHLGIHKGTTVNILGYVQSQSDLAGWLAYQKIN
jgi:murein DD-endopeptidase MepM/ murein hydrolase activator NlpD